MLEVNPRDNPRILLINPRFTESFWSFRWALDEVLPGKKAINPPLGLATVAALTPEHWSVRIVDENIEPVPEHPDVDIVGICGMAAQYERQCALVNHYQERGRLVVVGGSYASLCPERYEAVADVVVAGEAERIWPEFCRDYARGTVKRLYQETGEVSLAESPTPRFDLLALEKYARASLQFSRGCPYRCEFCDIIVMFGRRPRTKSPEQIGLELDALRLAGVKNVFFVDDNLIGHKPRAKALLKYIAEYQRQHDYTFQFGVEASINLANDDVLLSLFRSANAAWVFIGIESPDKASLVEANKSQNLALDILESVRKLYQNGIEVLGGFIIGFDNDSVDVFEKQYRFIVDSGIQIAMVGLLTALPKTPLHQRLAAEGRLIATASADNNTQATTNFLPKRMTFEEMSQGYTELYRRLTRDRTIADRILNKTRYLKQAVAPSHQSLMETIAIVGRFAWHGLLPGGPARVFHFTRSLMRSSPRVWPTVISDWIAGLSLTRFVESHLTEATKKSDRNNAYRAYRRLQRTWMRAMPSSQISIDTRTIEVAVSLTQVVDIRMFKKATRKLTRLVRSGVRLHIRLDDFNTAQAAWLNIALQKLSKYGDRITLSIGRGMRPFIEIDFSAFHIALEEG